MSSVRRRDLVALATASVVFVLDQLTKMWVERYFLGPPAHTPVLVLPPLLDLQYVRNTGVAFSLFAGQGITYVFIAVAVAVIGYLYWHTRNTAPLAATISFGLVLGGAAGNVLDRMVRQYVVDFVHFQIPGVLNFAVFNLADSAISLGVILLAFTLWRGGQPIAPSRQPTTHPTHETSEPDVRQPMVEQ